MSGRRGRSLDRGTNRRAVAAEEVNVETLLVECLRCGHQRSFSPGPRRQQEAGACPRCDYVGWAWTAELNERTRRLVRELPVEARLRLRTV